jgi:hypothetical protein
MVAVEREAAARSVRPEAGFVAIIRIIDTEKVFVDLAVAADI